ncbi:MAG: sugar MFS transporter, partial [Cellvibrio sp.]
MAGIPESSTLPLDGESTKSNGGLILALIYITTLFFIWAFVTNLIDPLVANTKKVFTLTDAETQLNQFAFFIAYGIMSIPAAYYLSRKGYANSIILGLLGVIAGCLIAFSTAFTNSFMTILLGLFVAASGITLLQVAANPLIASMGNPEGAAFRLNLSQSFNSMGAFIGGIVGAKYLLDGELFEQNTVVTQEMKDHGLSFVTSTYIYLAIALAVFTFAVFLVRKTIATHAPKVSQHSESPFAALKSKWANLGSIAIFLYVGAEVCVISGMIFFLAQPEILNVSDQIAGYIAPFFMLFAMAGRFIGSALLRFYSATSMLLLVAVGAVTLTSIVILTYQLPALPIGGSVSIGSWDAPLTLGFIPGAAAVLIGLFNSIMFPTIFTLTLERSSAPASATSGLMCMAICGGGFISVLYGFTVDQLLEHFSIGARSLAFIVPLICYIYVLWFALAAKKAPTHTIQEGV